MFDVFYFDKKPNLFPHEQKVSSIQHAQTLCRTRFFWIVNYLCDYSDFDFLWEPVPWEADQRHAWASQWQKDSGTYLIPKNGFIDTNYRTDSIVLVDKTNNNWHITEDLDPTNFDFTWHPDQTEPPYIYQFGTQWQKTGGPRYVMPGATEVKYVTFPRATRIDIDQCWQLDDSVDYEHFDFTWHPDSTEPPYIYQFGTQWQKTGGPRYVMPGATEVKYVKQNNVKVVPKATAIVEIDHLDGNTGQIPNTIKTARYFDNYRDTLIRLARNIGDEHEYVWVCSSICDYAGFDFSWHPEAWQSTMLHVFASNDQKFGDTFFMHVPTFAEQAEKKALLDWYDINYVPNISVPRRSMPVISHNDDTHVAAVKTQDWAGPLALFTVDTVPITLPTVSLWRTETKNIVPLSAGASAVIVPKTAKADIRTQLYDYPFIDKTERKRHGDRPLDIVFISNGETNADYNYEKLKFYAGDRNRIKRVDRVPGRVAAYHAAAQASTTPWFFAVFAKLEVNPEFNWSWQPDRLQQPKHYIFHARNPVNGLEYGHMSAIAYNKTLVLENNARGLDFTLDSEHEVVPILSGTAYYASDIWTCWRTAFRECVKLKDSLPNVENEYRLNQWLTKDNTDGQWSIKGATDAVEYYDAVKGDFNELKKSYDWEWLHSYAMLKYGSMWNRS